MEKDVYLALINTIMERIEYLENNDPDNANLDELRLLLSDNVSKDGKIHIRSLCRIKKLIIISQTIRVI